MNKIYKSGNYIILETTGGLIYEMPINNCHYNFDDTNNDFRIYENGLLKETIPAADVEPGNLWFLEDGITNYTIATLTTFLRDNTGFNPVGTLQNVSDVPAYDLGNAGDYLELNPTKDGFDWKTPVAPQKVLIGHMTQAGAADPVLTILKNTTGFTFTGTRTGVGNYGILTVEDGNVADFWAIFGSNDDAVIRWPGNTDNFNRVQIDLRKHMLNGAANADGLNHVSFHVEFLG